MFLKFFGQDKVAVTTFSTMGFDSGDSWVVTIKVEKETWLENYV